MLPELLQTDPVSLSSNISDRLPAPAGVLHPASFALSRHAVSAAVSFHSDPLIFLPAFHTLLRQSSGHGLLGKCSILPTVFSDDSGFFRFPVLLFRFLFASPPGAAAVLRSYPGDTVLLL